jgi:hypothetical protein
MTCPSKTEPERLMSWTEALRDIHTREVLEDFKDSDMGDEAVAVLAAQASRDQAAEMEA